MPSSPQNSRGCGPATSSTIAAGSKTTSALLREAAGEGGHKARATHHDSFPTSTSSRSRSSAETSSTAASSARSAGLGVELHGGSASSSSSKNTNKIQDHDLAGGATETTPVHTVPQPQQQDEPASPARIKRGFHITRMRMKDATTGELLWRSENWDTSAEETEIHIPARVLQCKAVAREIEFQSKEQIEKFRLEQVVFFRNAILETWDFEFGFVIPGSTYLRMYFSSSSSSRAYLLIILCHARSAQSKNGVGDFSAVCDAVDANRRLLCDAKTSNKNFWL
ncbi:unnamed protein product [Amoebophrya sp. A120]|nr:unnamed protein product [Amoebophrya sp. A120]|eukprot:GSA120T00013189001.1